MPSEQSGSHRSSSDETAAGATRPTPVESKDTSSDALKLKKDVSGNNATTKDALSSEKSASAEEGMKDADRVRRDKRVHVELGGLIHSSLFRKKGPSTDGTKNPAAEPAHATGDALAQHDVEKVQEKKDLDKTNAERAAEGEADLEPREKDGKIVLSERAGYLATGYSFPTWKKWAVLSVIFVVQMSMNFNTSVFP